MPIPDGSVVYFYVRLKNQATPQEVNAALKAASITPQADGGLEGILQFSMADDFVSSDVIGNPHSSVVDGLLTKPASEGKIKLTSWYDNEWGYANRTAELIAAIARKLGGEDPKKKLAVEDEGIVGTS